ncbi:O-antigen polymerase [Synergistales bacterium]|nr:O-antigen polymerase [Synergistales bacterium]
MGSNPNFKKNKSRTAVGVDRLSVQESLPLVPAFILVPLWCVSLALPNLVYSGTYWYDTLHLMKFFVAGVPVALAAIVAGVRLVIYGQGRIKFKLDTFGAVWLALLAYCVAQPLWTEISSSVSFFQEFLCFTAVWVFYLLSWNSFPGRTIRPVLWLANVNAAVNVIFAELQMRNMNGITSLILPTPGNYIGNTGQQNMFGLWMAVCIMSSIYLYIAYATTPSGKKRHPAVTLLNLVLMGINLWGLWNSTSRSAMLSLALSLMVLGFITLRQFGKEYVKRLSHVVILFILVVIGAYIVNPGRMTENVNKAADMFRNAETIGGREYIWATSGSMFKLRPWRGVGIGQYKWHYLEGQRELYKTTPEAKWQYTHWAHNEFLQWFCEAGVVGGVLLLALWGFWGASLAFALWRKEHVALEVIWACSLITLISFNAVWTRPFHRIENILWLSLAFSISNRDMLTSLFPKGVFNMERMSRAFGAFILAGAFGGLYYLGDGMYGDRALRMALNTTDALEQRGFLEESSKHFMMKNEASKNLAYHYIRVGELMSDVQMTAEGVQMLWEFFQREPHSEELRVLLDWAQRFQKIDMLQYLASFMKPGQYQLRVIDDAMDSSGNVVSAVVLAPSD